MSTLVCNSAAVYRRLRWRGCADFEPVCRLELAGSTVGGEVLSVRAAMAAEAGIPAKLINPADATTWAPQFVDRGRVQVALRLPCGDTARARITVAALGASAAASGVRFRPRAKAVGIDLRGDGVVRVRTATGGSSRTAARGCFR